MSDLTERAIDVARGRLRSEYGGSAVEVTIAALDDAGMLTDPDAEVRAAAVRAEADRDRYRDALAELLNAIGVGRDDHRHKYLNVTVARADLDAARKTLGASS